MFRETLRRPLAADKHAHRPQGLMGREVANCTFLTALLRHTSRDHLGLVLDSIQDRPAALAYCQEHLGGRPRPCRVQLRPRSELSAWLRVPGTRVLHCPQPPDAAWAWKRASGPPHRLAISGVTHTLASAQAIGMLRDLVTAPFATYDRLFCTSHAVLATVRAVTSAWCDYWAGRTGRRPELALRLELLPLGVDTQQHRPARAAERSETRRRLGIAHDDRVILFVGRLSHHAKAQPFPMLQAAEHAARRLSSRVHLVFCGWFANDAVRQAFRQGATTIAPSVRTHFVDGLNPLWRDQAWHAADVFVSLSDSIQETFGLTVVEAQARGLPVVVSDWNGYRELVLAGQTGFLVKTAMLRDSLPTQAQRLVTDEINYDQFLAEIGQAVAVDGREVAEILASLLADDDRLCTLGTAARKHADAHFAWPRVMAMYEQMWEQQRRELRDATRPQRFHRGVQVDAAAPREPTNSPSPAEERPPLDGLYPPVERTFADYPTGWLHASSLVRAAEDAVAQLPCLLELPLVHHVGPMRLTDRALLENLLSAARETTAVEQLVELLRKAGAADRRALPTIAWLIKYGLLEPLEWPTRPTREPGWGRPVRQGVERVSLTTTCMGRLPHLQQSLPRMLAQRDVEVVVVDYSCWQGTTAWVRQQYPETSLVEVRGRTRFDRSEAKNLGAFAATSDWLCLIDADVLLEPDFVDRIRGLLQPGCFLRADRDAEGTGGTIIVPRAAFEQVGGHDPVFMDWGEEDDDLVDALHFIGLRQRGFPAGWIRHIEHDDALRTRCHEESDRRVSHMANRVYRAAKWDLARLLGRVPALTARRELYSRVRTQIRTALAAGQSTEVRIDAQSMYWLPISAACRRELVYRVELTDVADLQQDVPDQGRHDQP